KSAIDAARVGLSERTGKHQFLDVVIHGKASTVGMKNPERWPPRLVPKRLRAGQCLGLGSIGTRAARATVDGEGQPCSHRRIIPNIGILMSRQRHARSRRFADLGPASENAVRT